MPAGTFTSYLLLAVVLLAAGVLTCAAAVALSAWSLLCPPRMTDGKALYLLRRISPSDLGLRYEDVSFTVRDESTGGELRIAGWWVPVLDGGREIGDRCVVLLHGYADAKVGAIAWAPLWHGLGFHVLAIDLRAHGESGGRHSTAGWRERHDVAQVVHQLRAERPGQARHVVLFGVSLGAAVAAAAAALREGDAPAVELSAVVLESPVADFRHAAGALMALHGLPGGRMHAATLAVAEKVAGVSFRAVRTVDLIRGILCPVMLITSADDDPCLAAGDAKALEAAVRSRPPERGPSVYWQVGRAGHAMAAAADPDEYERRLASFLDEALADAGRQVAAP